MASFAEREKQNARRQQMLQALISQAAGENPTGQMVSGHYVNQSLGQSLLPAIKILAGNYALGNAEKDAEMLRQEKVQAMSDALAKSSAETPTEDRIKQFMQSDIPELQAMGMKLFESTVAPSKPEKFGNPTQMRDKEGKLVNVLIGDRGTIKPVEGYDPYTKLEVSRGEVYDPTQVKPGQRIGAPYQAAQTNVNVVMPGQEVDPDYVSFVKQMGKEDATAYRELESQVSTYDNIDQYLGQQKTLLESGATTGGFAPTLATFNNALQTLGVSLSPALENTKLMTNRESAMKAGLLQGPGAARLTDKDMAVFGDAIEIAKQGNPQKAIEIMQNWNNNQRRMNRLQRQRIEKKYPKAPFVKEGAEGTDQPLEVPSVPGVDTGASAVQTPSVGQEMDGYIFTGGNPSDPKSWRKK